MKKIINSFSIRETAKIIKFPGGEKQFFSWLRDNRYLMKNNEPYQRYINNGWFELVTKTNHKTNPKMVITVTLVKLKGAASLEKIVMQKFPPCVPCNQIIKLKKTKNA
jgi:phage antirepressor YoqD-like protein